MLRAARIARQRRNRWLTGSTETWKLRGRCSNLPAFAAPPGFCSPVRDQYTAGSLARWRVSRKTMQAQFSRTTSTRPMAMPSALPNSCVPATREPTDSTLRLHVFLRSQGRTFRSTDSTPSETSSPTRSAADPCTSRATALLTVHTCMRPTWPSGCGRSCSAGNRVRPTTWVRRTR